MFVAEDVRAMIGIRDTTGTELNSTAVGLTMPLKSGENQVRMARPVPTARPPASPTAATNSVTDVFST